MNDRAVLITGAGLVGCHAAAQLGMCGYRTVLLDLHPDPFYIDIVAGSAAPQVVHGDVADCAMVTQLLRSEQIKLVVHTTGLVGQKAEQHPYLAFRVNVAGTAAVAEACRLTSVRRLIHISSLAVYDWQASTDQAVAETAALGPRTVYGATKMAAETLVRAYGQQWLETCILRLASVYGYGHFRGGSRFGLLLQRAVARSLKHKPARLPANFGSYEYVSARDVARAIQLALGLETLKHNTYNIGTGQVHTPAEVAATIVATLPGASVSASVPQAQFCPLDIRRATAELGYTPQDSLAVGIAHMARMLATAPAASPEEKLDA